ncbi:OmpA family protein [Flavisphingomonas formosensis]|uniref:OmpA family protein n=1 Tax=Flavisphingomonas formosensis TaxID=861534 RepID=UPI0012F8B17D|nr:OmpA family protein [Sphingomonas formosensis]
MRRTKHIRIGMPALLALAVVSACHRPSPVQTKPEGKPGPAELIELPNGTIAARPGSAVERMAHYLASQEPAPRTFRFEEAEFAPWSAHPNRETLGTLASIGVVLRQYPQTRIRLTGYTDNVGDAGRNLTLSTQRVTTLKALLIAQGVPEDHIETQGMGMADPIADNGTEAGRARNRRVEITITQK